ncbi:MAG: PKD domain-containing protein, partial [Bacteroidota bacterium]
MTTTPPGYLGNIQQWVWDFGDGNSQTIIYPANPNICYTFQGAALTHIVTLTVKTSDNCIGSVSHTVTSVPSPVANFTFSTTSCAGSSVNFTDLTQLNGGGSIIGWNWEFGDAGSGSSNFSLLQNPSHTYSIGGSYMVKLIVHNINNCTDTIFKSVVVNQLPVASFNADSVCLHSATTFTNTSVANASGIFSYSWNFGDASPPNTQPNPTHVYLNYGLYTVTLTIVNTNGCTASATKQVLVHPLPIPEFTYTTPSCQGSAVHFTNLSSTVPGFMGTIIAWKWHWGDGSADQIINFPGNPNVTHIFSGTALSHNVRLTVTTADNCVDSIEHQVNSVPAPIANFGYPASSNCTGQSVQFNDLSQMNGGGPIISWAWNFGDPSSGGNNSSNTQNPVHIFTGAGNFNVSLIVINSSGCSDTVIPAKIVTVNAKPVANFSADTACLGNLTTFSDLSTSASGAISQHHWDFGDGGSSSQTSPTYMYANAGTYTVKLTVTTVYGCIKDTTKQVKVNPNPVAAFTFSAPTCSGDSVQFTNLSTTPGSAIHTWKWEFGDGQSATVTFPTSPNVRHKYVNAGTYNVKLTVTTTDSCKNFIIMPVIIQPRPAANFDFASIRCAEMPVSFNDLSQATGGIPIVAWDWNFGDPTSGNLNTSTVQNPSHSFTAGTPSFNVKLHVTNANGCTDTITKAVAVNAAPMATFTTDTACVGTTTHFTDGSTAGSGNLATWLWNFGEPS